MCAGNQSRGMLLPSDFNLKIASIRGVVFTIHGSGGSEEIIITNTPMIELQLNGHPEILPTRIAVGDSCLNPTMQSTVNSDNIIQFQNNNGTLTDLSRRLVCCQLSDTFEYLSTTVLIRIILLTFHPNTITDSHRMSSFSNAVKLNRNTIAVWSGSSLSFTMYDGRLSGSVFLDSERVPEAVKNKNVIFYINFISCSVTDIHNWIPLSSTGVLSQLPSVGKTSPVCVLIKSYGHSSTVLLSESIMQIPVSYIGLASVKEPVIPILVDSVGDSVLQSDLPTNWFIGVADLSGGSCSVISNVSSGNAISLSSEIWNSNKRRQVYQVWLCVGDSDTELVVMDVLVVLIRISFTTRGEIETKTLSVTKGQPIDLSLGLTGGITSLTVGTNSDTRILLVFSLQNVSDNCNSDISIIEKITYSPDRCALVPISADQLAVTGSLSLCVYPQLSSLISNNVLYSDVGLRLISTEMSRLHVVSQPTEVSHDGRLTTQPSIAVVDAGGNRVLFSGQESVITATWIPLPPTGQSVFTATAAAGVSVASFTDVTLQGLYGLGYHLQFTMGLINVTSTAIIKLQCETTFQYAPYSEISCLPCPSGASCNGTLIIEPKPDYWRSGNSSVIFYLCKTQGICLPEGCRDGHVGPKCSQCLPGWGMGGGLCTKCGSETQSIIVVVVIASVALICMCVFVASTLRAAQNISNPVPIMIKITVNHLVISSRLGDFSTQFPGLLRSLFSVEKEAAAFGVGSISQTECASEDFSTYEVFLLWMAVPIFIMVGTWSIPACMMIYNTIQKMKGTHHKECEEEQSTASEEDITDNPILYIKIQFNKLRGGTSADAVSISGISLRRGTYEFVTEDYDFVENPDGSSPADGGCDKLQFDFNENEDVESSWTDFNRRPLIVKLSSKQTVSGLTFKTSSNTINRDPIRWSIYWSATGKTWERVFIQGSDFTTPTDRCTTFGSWFPLLPSKGGLIHIYAVSVVILLYVVYPLLVERAALMLSCEEIDIGLPGENGLHFINGDVVPLQEVRISETQTGLLEYYTRRASIDMSLSCDTDEHQAIMIIAIILLIFYGVGIPGCMALVVYCMRRHRGRRNAFTMFHFLVSGLSKNRWYWELLTMIRKMLIIVVINFIPASHGEGRLQTYCAMWVIAVFLIATLIMQPFNMRMDGKPHQLEVGSLSVLTATLNLSLLYSYVNRPPDVSSCSLQLERFPCISEGCEWSSTTDSTNATCTGSDGVQWLIFQRSSFILLTAVLLFLNVGFLVVLLYRLLPRIANDYSEKIRQLLIDYPCLVPQHAKLFGFGDWLREWAKKEDEGCGDITDQVAHERRRRSTVLRKDINPLLARTDVSEDNTETEEGTLQRRPNVNQTNNLRNVDEWSSDSDDGPDTRQGTTKEISEEIQNLRSDLNKANDYSNQLKSHLQRDQIQTEALRRSYEDQIAALTSELGLALSKTNELKHQQIKQKLFHSTALSKAQQSAAENLDSYSSTKPQYDPSRLLSTSHQISRASADSIRNQISKVSFSDLRTASILCQSASLNVIQFILMLYGNRDQSNPLITMSWGFWSLICDLRLGTMHREIVGILKSMGMTQKTTLSCSELLYVLSEIVGSRERNLTGSQAMRHFLSSVPKVLDDAKERPSLLSVSERLDVIRSLKLDERPHPVLNRAFMKLASSVSQAPGYCYFIPWNSFLTFVRSIGLCRDSAVALQIYSKSAQQTIVMLPHQFIEAIYCMYKINTTQPWINTDQMVTDMVRIIADSEMT